MLSWCSSQQLLQEGQIPAHKIPLVAGFDNTEATYLLTREILNMGHRNISMIAGDSRNNDRARARIAGVKRAIDEHQSIQQNSDQISEPAKLLRVMETEYSLDNGGKAFETLISDDRKPTVIICGNDVLAAGAIVRAKQLGMNIPREVSITGFDDIALASAVTPALTTVSVPQEAMGRAAAQLLLKSLNTNETLSNVDLQTRIVYRDSLRAISKKYRTLT